MNLKNKFFTATVLAGSLAAGCNQTSDNTINLNAASQADFNISTDLAKQGTDLLICGGEANLCTVYRTEPLDISAGAPSVYLSLYGPTGRVAASCAVSKDPDLNELNCHLDLSESTRAPYGSPAVAAQATGVAFRHI